MNDVKRQKAYYNKNVEPDRILVRMVEKRHDAWLDIALREIREGPAYFFEVKDPKTGLWLMKIVKDSELGKIILTVRKRPQGKTFAQLENKSITLKRCPNPEFVYHPLRVTYVIDDKLRTRRVSRINQVPIEIRKQYEIHKYEEATKITKPPPFLKGKIVVVIKNDDFEGMAKLFILEKVWPAIRS